MDSLSSSSSLIIDLTSRDSKSNTTSTIGALMGAIIVGTTHSLKFHCSNCLRF